MKIELFPEAEELYIDPFIKGQYSKLGKKLMNTYPKFVPTGKIYNLRGFPSQVLGFSLQRKICLKEKDLKEYWENRIGVYLSDDAEVWSKIKESEEFYQKSKANSQEDPSDSGGIGPIK